VSWQNHPEISLEFLSFHQRQVAIETSSASCSPRKNGGEEASGKTFTSDKDNKTWTIQNPEAVKGHEGHHVVLNAHVYPDKNEVHVMSLKMAKDNMKSDSSKY
jgi:hypothetical protein